MQKRKNSVNQQFQGFFSRLQQQSFNAFFVILVISFSNCDASVNWSHSINVVFLLFLNGDNFGRKNKNLLLRGQCFVFIFSICFQCFSGFRLRKSTNNLKYWPWFRLGSQYESNWRSSRLTCWQKGGSWSLCLKLLNSYWSSIDLNSPKSIIGDYNTENHLLYRARADTMDTRQLLLVVSVNSILVLLKSSCGYITCLAFSLGD